MSFIKSCLRIHYIFLYFQDYVISGTGRHRCFEMKECLEIRGRSRLPLILKCINTGTAYAKIFYLSDALRTLSNLYYKTYIQTLLVHHQFWVWTTVCNIFFYFQYNKIQSRETKIFWLNMKNIYLKQLYMNCDKNRGCE